MLCVLGERLSGQKMIDPLRLGKPIATHCHSYSTKNYFLANYFAFVVMVMLSVAKLKIWQAAFLVLYVQ